MVCRRKKPAILSLSVSDERVGERTILNNPKKTPLSLCYVKKKLYFCTRKINGKRARGSKNRQKRDFNVKISTKK